MAAAFASMTAAFFSAVAATSSTDAAISVSALALLSAAVSSAFVCSPTPRMLRAISSIDTDVASTAVAISAASRATFSSAAPAPVTVVAVAVTRSPTDWASLESLAMPFDISSIVAATSSVVTAFDSCRVATSPMLALISDAAARSSSLAAARSSAFALTPFTERAVCSSVVTVPSADAARTSCPSSPPRRTTRAPGAPSRRRLEPLLHLARHLAHALLRSGERLRGRPRLLDAARHPLDRGAGLLDQRGLLAPARREASRGLLDAVGLCERIPERAGRLLRQRARVLQTRDAVICHGAFPSPMTRSQSMSMTSRPPTCATAFTKPAACSATISGGGLNVSGAIETTSRAMSTSRPTARSPRWTTTMRVSSPCSALGRPKRARRSTTGTTRPRIWTSPAT
jgi:hypothetical protein